MKTLKTCKTGCGKMKSGGPVVKKVKKLAKGGTMFGIPQENLGTSGQYGFAQKGGMVKKQNGGKVNYLPSKAAYDKSISDMGGPDNPPVQLSPREIYKAKMDQKKRSVVNKMFPTTGIPKSGVGVKKEMVKGAKGGKVGSKTLKPVSADQKGLAKLPTAVRNKMGYQRSGGVIRKKR